ncbi:multicopper oxidase domain-containing protein [Paenibacillus durus]|uniref:multicopper oxidase domain-containing protein n=1 Tax=Paenibacillus durus TaxID=44251 RepID=UPI001E56A1B1|nr:multicopper oxidase domain-containing protein [Paenibacillus durus]
MNSNDYLLVLNQTTNYDDPHPIHLHLVNFQILDRQPFDASHFQKTGNLIFTGPPTPPNPYEMGLKEFGPPFYVTSVIALFGPFTGRMYGIVTCWSLKITK